MDWNEAKRRIQTKITVGCDLNSDDSTYRSVKLIDDERIVVFYNKKRQSISFSWDMLEKCFFQLSSGGFNRAFFKKAFPECCVSRGKTQGEPQHHCSIHIIGQIFVRADLANDENKGNGTTFYAL